MPRQIGQFTAHLLSIGMGCTVAASLWVVLPKMTHRTTVPRAATRIQVRAAPALSPVSPESKPSSTAPAAVLLLPTPVVTNTDVPASTESVSTSELPTISQPELANGTRNTTPEVLKPAIGVQEAPPAPPNVDEDPFSGEVFADKPGGNILILGLLIDDHGKVLDNRILVPSNAPLLDLSALYASRDQTWKDIFPPMLPGEQRWIQQRIDFSDRYKLNPQVLP